MKNGRSSVAFAAGLTLTAAVSAVARADGLPTTAPVDQLTWALLSDGKQFEAEAALRERIRARPGDAHSIFTLGVLTRSRFDVDNAARLFIIAIELDPKSLDATAAKAMLEIDRMGASGFKNAAHYLGASMKMNPDEPAYPWLLAIVCRTCDRNEEGVVAFAELGKHFKTGPVLFHQTYANMLDGLGRFDESLKHRDMAVRLEPASWAFQGMANTLRQMGRPADAIPIYKKALALRPTDWLSLNQMCGCAVLVNDRETLVPAAHRLADVKPKWAQSHVYVAIGLYMQNDDKAAADEMKTALALAPNDAELVDDAARMLRSTGRAAEADKLVASRLTK